MKVGSEMSGMEQPWMIFRIADQATDCMAMPLIVWILEKEIDSLGVGELDDVIGQDVTCLSLASTIPSLPLCPLVPS